MASRGFTSPDNLPYPNNVNDPADVPPEIRVLAEATQTALNLKIPNTRRIIAGDGLVASPAENLAQDITLSVRVKAPLKIENDQVAIDTAQAFPPTAHDHAYAAPHDHPYAASGHTHSYRTVGMEKGEIDFGSLSPGQEKVYDISKPSGATVLITVQHTSTYIFATADNKSDVLTRVNCRNGTSSTTHTNVKVSYLIVNAAG